MKCTTHIKFNLAIAFTFILFSPIAVRGEVALSDQVLLLAEEVGRWLADNAIEYPDGIAWPDDVLNPETVSYDFGSGVAGKVTYFVALYRATGNPDYLGLATGGADYLVALLNEPATFDDNNRKAGLYTGIPGIGVALLHVQQHAQAEKYRDALGNVLDLLDEWSIEDSGGLRWSDEFNDLLYGDAGTILYLSWYAEQTGDRRAAGLAHRGAKFLLGQAVPADAGKYWLFRRSREFNLPNFSHGTAGVSYVLATVAAQSGDESLKLGAQAGFDYIKSITENFGDFIRIPYGWGSENWVGMYEAGWAHGLAGTSYLFMRLQQTGIDAAAAAEYERLARDGLQMLGRSRSPVPAFAEPATEFDLRFGKAGILMLASDWAKDDLIDLSAMGVNSLQHEVWTDIAEAAVRDEGTAHWELDAPEFMGGGRAAYTGLLHGAAGIGLAILEMHARMSGQPAYVSMPDRPADMD